MDLFPTETGIVRCRCHLLYQLLCMGYTCNLYRVYYRHWNSAWLDSFQHLFLFPLPPPVRFNTCAALLLLPLFLPYFAICSGERLQLPPLPHYPSPALLCRFYSINSASVHDYLLCATVVPDLRAFWFDYRFLVPVHQFPLPFGRFAFVVWWTFVVLCHTQTYHCRTL